MAKQYRKCIVTFIDILGFSNLVKNKTADEINKILIVLKNNTNDKFGHEKAIPDEGSIEYLRTSLAFSDCVTRITPYDLEDLKGNLFIELLSMAIAQAELAAKGIIIRGAITIGDISYDDDENIVYGPALVKAAELEKIANYPRILIDHHALDEFNEAIESGKTNAEEKEYVDKYIKTDSDGRYFIDFAQIIYTEMDDPEGYPEFLNNLNNMSKEYMKKYITNPSIFEKYKWLNDYIEESITRCGL